MITQNLYSRIHALAAAVPLDDAEYRNMLHDLYGKRSSKALTLCQQRDFIDILCKQIKARQKRRNPEMATPRQLNAIKAMWANVSRAETAEAKDIALLKFCKRITGCERPEWLRKTDVRKLIKALEKMGASTPEQWNQKQPTSQQEDNHG